MRDETAAPDPRRELEREVARVADRLRILSPARLAEPLAEHPSRAAAGRALAQALADAAALVEAGGQTPPVRRLVPVLSDVAVGDQVAVTGTDLLRAADRAPPADTARVLDIVSAAREQVTGLRRAL